MDSLTEDIIVKSLNVMSLQELQKLKVLIKKQQKKLLKSLK